MGKTLMGGATHEGNIDLLTPEQQQFLGGILGGPMSQLAGQAYQSFLQPYSAEQYEDVFNKAVVDPAMMQYEQQVLPAIQQRFVDANAGSSSALNQALAQSAGDLTTQLGSQYLNFFNQQQANQLSALGGLGGLAGQQTFQPLVSQGGGILGPLIGAAGTIGGAAMMSSEKVKENIEDFKKLGLKDLLKFKVKKYDYIEEVGGQKDKIGLIAEELPKELTAEKDGILHVDLYALMSVMINAMQELNDKIVQLEDK